MIRGNVFMKMSFYDWCVQNNSKHLLKLWDYELNIVGPDEISCCSTNEYYFKCEIDKHNSSKWKITYLTRRVKVKTVCRYCNSFAQKCIDQYGEDALDKFWDYDKNAVSPWEISYGANVVIYIKCQNNIAHGSYETSPSLFLNKHIGCAYCHSKGKKVHPDDSFAAFYKKKYGDDFLEKYWDYDRNIFDPYKITPSTNRGYIYLYCQEDTTHGSYQIMPNNFKRNGFSCPICYHEREDSILQGLVGAYLKNEYKLGILHEFSCSIVCKNPITLKALPYDNEIVVNDVHLIIEVHGEQHYNPRCGWNRKESKRRRITPEQALEDQQYRDKIKKDYALSCGYEYLEIPYWTERDESYKTLIDNKIQTLNTTK